MEESAFSYNCSLGKKKKKKKGQGHFKEVKGISIFIFFSIELCLKLVEIVLSTSKHNLFLGRWGVWNGEWGGACVCICASIHAYNILSIECWSAEIFTTFSPLNADQLK